jgi:2-dehydro-3-deoxyphosphogluconate aldolase/(4S)-4-hydroxy-2-oxoglutarate aldolase
VTIEDLRSTGVIAVLRAPSPETALECVSALIEGGVTGIEITYSTPDAPAVIEQVRRVHPEAHVGAGTIRTVGEARQAAGAGAQFLVSPGTRDELAAAMLDTGLTTLLGAMTPSEVMHAVELGAHAVKIFPASLGGPSFLKALRGPFPDVPLVPTGGVSAANVGDWLAAGALAVGAGGELCPSAAIASGDRDEIIKRARAFTAALAKARA